MPEALAFLLVKGVLMLEFSPTLHEPTEGGPPSIESSQSISSSFMFAAGDDAEHCNIITGDVQYIKT